MDHKCPTSVFMLILNFADFLFFSNTVVMLGRGGEKDGMSVMEREKVMEMQTPFHHLTPLSITDLQLKE